jgi:hypothetical protein
MSDRLQAQVAAGALARIEAPPAGLRWSGSAGYLTCGNAVLVGTHNASHVDRWPLVAALCRDLRDAA